MWKSSDYQQISPKTHDANIFSRFHLKIMYHTYFSAAQGKLLLPRVLHALAIDTKQQQLFHYTMARFPSVCAFATQWQHQSPSALTLYFLAARSHRREARSQRCVRGALAA